MTDIVVTILSFYFMIQGASRGFVRSLLFPLSLILATFIGYLYYQYTKEIVICLVLMTIGPFLLSLLLKHLLKTWAKATNTEIKPSPLSRLGGSLVTLAWGWVFIIFALILLAVVPPWGRTLTAIQHDVLVSNSYFVVKPWGKLFFGAYTDNASAAASDASSPPGAPNPAARSLADDPRFQEVLKDPEIQKEIEAHDFVKLMANPKMISLTQQIMGDPATMKKVLSLYNSQTDAVAPKKEFPDLTK